MKTTFSYCPGMYENPAPASWLLQISEFVWMLRSSVWIVFNNFLLIDATDKVRLVAIESAYFSRTLTLSLVQ